MGAESIFGSLGAGFTVIMPLLQSVLSSSNINIGKDSKFIENALFSGRTQVSKNVQDVIDSIEREKILNPLLVKTQESNNRWLRKFYINTLGKTPQEAEEILKGDGLLNTALNWVIDGQKKQVIQSFDRALKFKGIISPYTGGQITNNNQISAVGSSIIEQLFNENNAQNLGQLNAVDVGNSIAEQFATGSFNNLINNPNAFSRVRNADGSIGMELKQGYKNGLNKRLNNMVTYDRLIDDIIPTSKESPSLKSKKDLMTAFSGADVVKKLGYGQAISVLKGIKSSSDMYGAKTTDVLAFLHKAYKAKGVSPINALLDYSTFLSTRQLAVNNFTSKEDLQKFTASLANQMVDAKQNPIMNTLGAGYSALYDVYGTKATDIINNVQKAYDMNIKQDPRLASANTDTKVNFIEKTINSYLSPKDQLTAENKDRYNYTTASSFFKNRMFDKFKALKDSANNTSMNLYNTIKNTKNLGLSYADQIDLKQNGVTSNSLNKILRGKNFRTADAKRQFVDKIKNTLNPAVQDSGFNNFKEYNTFRNSINSRNASNIPEVLRQRKALLNKSYNKGKRNFLNAVVDPNATLSSVWKNMTGGGDINLKDYLPQNSVNNIEKDMKNNDAKPISGKGIINTLIDKVKGYVK